MEVVGFRCFGRQLLCSWFDRTVEKAQISVEVCVLAAGSETNAGRALNENHKVGIARRISGVENNLSVYDYDSCAICGTVNTK
jgi:hypothetical protein